jgi:hypothetical protein
LEIPKTLTEKMTGRCCIKHPDIELYHIGDTDICGECDLEEMERITTTKRERIMKESHEALTRYNNSVKEKNKKRKK